MDSPAVESLRVQAWAASHAGSREYADKLFRQLIQDHPDSLAARDAQLYFADNPQSANAPPAQPIQRVTVVDLDISFGQLVSLFVKAAIAMIPAAIILGIIGFIVFAVVGAFVGGGSGLPRY